MAENYTESLIFTKNLDEKGTPFIPKLVEVAKVSENGRVQCKQNVYKKNGITIISPDGLRKVSKPEQLLEVTGAYFIYEDRGEVLFSEDLIGETVAFEYYGTGNPNIGDCRVFTTVDNNGNITETLNDIIRDSREIIESIKLLGGGIVILNKLEEVIANAETLNSALGIKITVGTEVSERLEQDINLGNELDSRLKSTITKGETVNSTLNSTINTGNATNQDLIGTINSAKTTDTALKQTIASGNQLKDEVADVVEDMATVAESINQSANKVCLINPTDWQLNSSTNRYEYTWTHGMDKSNLIFEYQTVKNGKRCSYFMDYEHQDSNATKFITETNDTVYVIATARYYTGLALHESNFEVDNMVDGVNKVVMTKAERDLLASHSSQLEQKANKDDVAKISSGTPLFASSTSEMTDTTKNYVNTSDGYLYTYSGGIWTKTTVQYQSTGIEIQSVAPSNLNKTLTENLGSYDSFSFTIENGYYNNTTGIFTTNSGWKSTKLNVNEGDMFLLSATINGALTSLCVMYDESNKIIQKEHTGIGGQDTVISNATISIPKNVKTITLTWKNNTDYSFKKLTINNTNHIKDDLKTISDNIVVKDDLINLEFDSDKCVFSLNNGIVKANFTSDLQGFVPCFFNKKGSMEFTHINQDTIIVIARDNGYYITYAIGNKDGSSEVTGTMFQFLESNGSNKQLRNQSIVAPPLNTIVKVEYDDSILKVYYDGLLKESVDINLLETDVRSCNFGVVKSKWNDNLNNGLIKNVTFNPVLVNKKVDEITEYINSMSNTSSFYANSYANFLGDSITQGVGTTKQYHQFIKEQLGLKDVRNYGIGGTCITNIESNNFISRFLSMDNNAELIVVFGGTNDFGHHMPLGDINSTDDKTFYGALKVLCEGLINKYVGKTIIFITPLNRNCDKFPADGCPKGQKTNNLGYKLEDYVNAIKEVVPMYSIPVYDLFSNSNLYPYNTSIITNFMPDGLHPNINGHKIIGRKIAEFINRQ